MVSRLIGLARLGMVMNMLTNIGNWKVAPGLAWNEQFALWLKNTPTKKRTERSALTLDAYLRDVKLFAEWFEKINNCPFDPALLNSTDVKAYFDGLRQSASPATHNRKLASVRMMVGWAREFGLLDVDPCEWIPVIDATRESPRDVAEADFASLERVAESGEHLCVENELLRARDLLIFRLMANAGLRIHEVVGLQLDDLHLEQGYIHILGKGQKHRKVKVRGGKLVAAIRAWLAIAPASLDGAVVTNEKGHSIHRSTAWARFTMIAELAGVKATPHAMRHTFIYRFMDAFMGGDWRKLPAAIDAVCQQTGDTPEVILAYYTRARESDICAAMEVM